MATSFTLKTGSVMSMPMRPIAAPLLGVAQEGAPNSSPDEDG